MQLSQIDYSTFDTSTVRNKFSDEQTEYLIRASTPVFVNSFNQLTYLKNILHWFYDHDFRNVFVIDQLSSYPPLLEYYQSPDFSRVATLLRLEQNIGPRNAVRMIKIWRHGIPFFFTDPDLEMPQKIDNQFASRFFRVSETYGARKVGIALALHDANKFDPKLTASGPYEGIPILDWEKGFWEKELETDVYRADVDTTFFLWNERAQKITNLLSHNRIVTKVRKKMGHRLMRDIRLAGTGFEARHLPWYHKDGWPEEEKEFYKKNRTQPTWWS